MATPWRQPLTDGYLVGAILFAAGAVVALCTVDAGITATKAAAH